MEASTSSGFLDSLTPKKERQGRWERVTYPALSDYVVGVLLVETLRVVLPKMGDWGPEAGLFQELVVSHKERKDIRRTRVLQKFSRQLLEKTRQGLQWEIANTGDLVFLDAKGAELVRVSIQWVSEKSSKLSFERGSREDIGESPRSGPVGGTDA
jgi:hypothetical protein